MVAAIARLPLIDRRHCRESFEQRFTARRMAEEYVGLYERMAAVQTRPYALHNGRSSNNHIVGTGAVLRFATPDAA
jgi:hypothetical protein